MSRGAVKRKTQRELEGVPGTVTHGFKEQEIVPRRLPQGVIDLFDSRGGNPEDLTLRAYEMGPCAILVGREPAGVNNERLWHLTISTPSRHPTWDEIKVARYRLLDPELCMGILLPPPELYVNLLEHDHVFQLWEIQDPPRPLDDRMKYDHDGTWMAPKAEDMTALETAFLDWAAEHSIVWFEDDIRLAEAIVSVLGGNMNWDET